jgi:predicted ATPase
MQRIELDNFRVFGTPAAFDLAPVTVLTGKNNSGKSSLIKAFLVLADYLAQEDQTVLRLDGKRASRHRISDWENMVNWNVDQSENLKFGYVRNGVEVSYEFEYEGEDLPPHLYLFRLTVPGVDQLTMRSIGGGEGYQLDVSQKLIDYLTGGVEIQKRILEAASYPQKIEALRQELEELEAAIENSQQPDNQAADFQQLLQARQKAQTAIQNLEALSAKAGSVAGIFFQAEVWLKAPGVKPTIAGLIKAALNDYVTANSTTAEEQLPEDEYDEAFDEVVSVLDEEEDVSEEALEMAREARRRTIAERNQERRKLELSKEQAYRTLVRFSDEVLHHIKFPMEHLGANRTHQARLYLTGNGHSDISTIANDFHRLGMFAGGGAHTFLTKWLDKFGIGERAITATVDNVAIRIGVIKNGRYVNLADLGFGAGQILTVLLQIATLIQKYELSGPESQRAAKFNPTIVLIEEPEANLHPQFQSLLAELFASLAQSDYGLQFVLETHSEYLIRNIQVLVKEAGGNLLERRRVISGRTEATLHKEEVPLFKVYYLDQPNEKNGYKYGHEMRLRNDGAFLDKFGEGFLDVARKLAFEVL